jgi:hypothetical protein
VVVLATTLEHWDEAAQHFEEALEMNARMKARPWLAHTQYQYATMLLTRNQSGDPSTLRQAQEASKNYFEFFCILTFAL